jgi:hypothetical protein
VNIMATVKEMDKLNAILEEAKDNEDEDVATRILDWATTMYPIWIIKIFKNDKHLRDILREDVDLKAILNTIESHKIVCPRCGLNPNDTQTKHQQEDEAHFVKRDGICTACVQELEENLRDEDERYAEVDGVYRHRGEKGTMRKFDVFWTFLANYDDKVRTVEAKSIKEAIEKSTFYDPTKSKDDGQYKMAFIVWEHGEGLVHHGTIDDVVE